MALAAAGSLLAACTASTDGAPLRPTGTATDSVTRPSNRPSTGLSTAAVSPAPSSTVAPTSTTGAPSAAPPTTATPCPGTDAEIIVTCLNSALSRYWTRTLKKTVRFVAVADPTRAQVPPDCRSGLTLRTAFTCPIDGNVYVTAPFLRGLAAVPPGADLPLRLASTMSHEAGHVVQLVEKFPPIINGKGDAASRTVEQQADCLSGVWAHAVGISDADFLRGARVVLTYVDNAFERRTHGTVAVRVAAIERGLAGRTAQSCGLTVR